MIKKWLAVFSIFAFMISGFPTSPAFAESASGLNEDVQISLKNFSREVPKANDILSKAKGVLVFPGIWKAGFVWGGEYGEGVMTVNGRATDDYYSIIALTLGFQLGIQKQTVILAFMDGDTLDNFRKTASWEFGLDASVALIKVGLDGNLNSYTHNEPIMVFVLDQKGLMGNVNLEGYKITRLRK